MAERRHGGRRGDARGGGRGGGCGDPQNEEAARQRDLRDIEKDDLRQHIRDLQRRLARLEKRRGKSNPMRFDALEHRSMDDDTNEPSDSAYDSIFTSSDAAESSIPVYDKPVYDEDIFDGFPGFPVYDEPVYDEDIFDGLPKLISKSAPPSVKFDDAEEDEGVAVDDDEEHGEAEGGNRLLGFMFGKVVGAGDLLGERAQFRRESSSQEGVEGLRALGVRDISYQLGFIASSVQISDGTRYTDIRKKKEPDEDVSQQFTTEELDDVQRMRNIPDFFNKLVDSSAPTIFCHQDIKWAIPLMVMCGIHKVTHEGINIRGDISVCIVGDPSCATSQFLKYTAGLVPRSVYTSQKSFAAAGLTANVAKEPETGQFSIEVGALIQADEDEADSRSSLFQEGEYDAVLEYYEIWLFFEFYLFPS